MRYEHFIGIRHLTATRHRFLNALTVLAIVGVALGVAAFTTVTSVAGGFVTSLQERVLGINAHVLVMKSGVYFSNYETVAETIGGVPGVRSTSPFIVREMLATSDASRARPGVMVKGVDIGTVVDGSPMTGLTVAGSVADVAHEGDVASDATPDAPPAGAALGIVLAERLGVEVGDTVTLVSPLRGLRSIGVDAAASGANYARIRVAAIVNAGYHDYDSRLILMDYRAVQQLIGMGDVVMGVEVRVDDPSRAHEAAEQFDTLLAAGRFRALDWRELNRNLFSSLELQKLALSFVMSLLVIVACTVILCVLTMLVLEKRREIAVLRSMGASAGGILRIFVFQGMAIGLVGTALGLVGGAALCAIVAAIDFPLAYEVYRVRSLPVDPKAWEFAAAAVGALAVCFIATLYPAMRAAAVSPVDALRYD